MGFYIDLLPALTDNYIPLVSDTELGLAMVIDPGDADVVLRALKAKDLFLALILNTHHHSDHVAGNARLQREYGAPIIAPAKEAHWIGQMARGVEEGDVITFSDLRGTVIETPGHTSGHVAYYFEGIKTLFPGDTLFSLGCGRLFEGTSAELWTSLTRLRALPDDTMVYFAHEYTERNGQFATAIDKDNGDLKQRVAEIAEMRRKGLPTAPVALGLEKKTNPFLRVDVADFQAALAKGGFPVDGTADPAALFGKLRAAKDRFAA